MKETKALDNKCPKCNAQITWDAKSNMFRCEYCGETATLEELQANSSAADKENNEKKEITEKDLTGFKCKNCGAEIISDGNAVSTFCVYCGSTAILKEKIDGGIYPDYVIPFKKTEKDARDAYKSLLKGKKFLPKNFSNEQNISKIRGVYIPFWAYDITVDGTIDFHCEDTREWEDSEYEYKETKSYDVTIDGHYDYEKILCDASKYFADDLMDSIAPFKFEDLKDYNHAYLSGYLADKYDVEQSETLEIAKERSKNSCISKAGTKTGHEDESYRGDTLKYNNKKTYYMYLPVYMLNTKFEDKMYTFAMNGQTGKIIGDLPMDKAKFTFAVIRTFILTFLIITVILTMMGV